MLQFAKTMNIARDKYLARTATVEAIWNNDREIVLEAIAHATTSEALEWIREALAPIHHYVVATHPVAPFFPSRVYLSNCPELWEPLEKAVSKIGRDRALRWAITMQEASDAMTTEEIAALVSTMMAP